MKYTHFPDRPQTACSKAVFKRAMTREALSGSWLVWLMGIRTRDPRGLPKDLFQILSVCLCSVSALSLSLSHTHPLNKVIFLGTQLQEASLVFLLAGVGSSVLKSTRATLPRLRVKSESPPAPPPLGAGRQRGAAAGPAQALGST